MKAPFYKIHLEGNKTADITDYVDSFTYEDCMLEDSMVSVQFYLSKAEALLNNVQIDKGTGLSFQFGFFGENPSPVHVAVLKDINPEYDNKGVSITLKGYDKGADMKRGSSNKVWKKSKTSDIVRQIAKKYKMEVEVQDTGKVWEDIPQGNMDDLEFIKYLADREENGSYVSYVRGNKLHFVKRGLDKQSAVTYTWGDGDTGVFISFKVKDAESRGKKGAHKTAVVGMDAATKKALTQVSDNKTEKDNTTLGEVKNVYNAVNGEFLYGLISKTIVSPADPKEANNLANTEKKGATLEGIKATMKILGNPHVGPNQIITVNGIIDRYCGNWLITKAAHDINGSGYFTTLELLKNGKKRGFGDKADKANTSKGPAKPKATVKARVYYAPTGERLHEINRPVD